MSVQPKKRGIRVGNVKYSIYKLIDPSDSQVNYVGMSARPYHRYGEHFARDGNKEKEDWVNGLAEKGLVPQLIVIETVWGSRQAAIREAFWIGYYLGKGAPLKNISQVASEDRYKKVPDSLKAFVEEQCTFIPGAIVFTHTLHERYKAYCQSREYVPLGKQQMSHELSEMYKKVVTRTHKRNPTNNAVERCFIGMDLQEQRISLSS